MAGRQAVLDKIRTPSGTEEILNKSHEKNLSVQEVLQEECAEREESWNHPVVTKDFLAREGLNLKADGRSPASKVSEFNKPHQKMILADYLDSIWTNSFSGNIQERYLKFKDKSDKELNKLLKAKEGDPYLDLSQYTEKEVQEQLAGASSIAAFEPGTPFRPYDQGDLDFDALEPEIPYATLIRSVDILEQFDKDIADYDVPSDNEMMRDTAEGTMPPEVRVKIGNRQATFRRLAISIVLGDSQVNSNNNIIISSVARLVRNIGVRYDDLLSNELITQVLGLNSPSEIEISATGNKIDPEMLLDIQYAFSNGKVADRVIGKKRSILLYKHTLNKEYGVYSGTPNAATADLAMPQIGNNVSRPMLMYFSDNTGLADHKLYAFDSRETMSRMEFTNGEYQSEDFDGVTAMHKRTFAKHIGYYMRKDPPYQIFDHES